MERKKQIECGKGLSSTAGLVDRIEDAQPMVYTPLTKETFSEFCKELEDDYRKRASQKNKNNEDS